jgi:hypothetical protein
MNTLNKLPQTNLVQEEAIEYIGRGWSVIPIHPTQKIPLIKWKEFQSRLATEDELDYWFKKFPDAQIAVVTGTISGLIVVDADSDNAKIFCKANSLTSPFAVKTKRGMHYYFQHPKHGYRKKNATNLYGVSHLDLRADGGYVLAPPSHGKAWEPFTIDWEDMPMWSGDGDLVDVNFSWENLDLSSVQVKKPEDYLPMWERMEIQIKKDGLLREGDGRNDMLIRFAGEKVNKGITGRQLRDICAKFTDTFFTHSLEKEEFENTIASAEEMHRNENPHLYDDGGRINKKFRPIYASDIEGLKQITSNQKYLVDPFLRPASIIQVYGYSGHGKSFITLTTMWHLALGKNFGPFEINAPQRVLYMDFENGASTVTDRLDIMNKSYGDPETNMMYWSSALIKSEDGGDMNLQTEEGLDILQGWLNELKPDVVVFDTIRTAFPGLMENNAEQWARINSICLKVRNNGASVIMLHHANKPTQDGLGREAGSTNQLTVVDQQLRITPIVEDKEIARIKAAKHDPAKILGLNKLLEGDSRLGLTIEMSYGKLRDHTDNHATVSIGFAERLKSGEQYIVSESSPKQKVLRMGMNGMEPNNIAKLLMIPTRTIRKWLGLDD